MIEVLAPAGNIEVAKAAILAGADAIYLGLKSFSARAYANNFSWEELEEIIGLAHFYGVKIHVTLNTLMTSNQLEEALETAHRLYEMQVDALIVQDLGFINLLRKYLKAMPLHASTQMNIHSLYGAQALEQLGFERVVLARETPLSVIGEIKEKTRLEVETFIHGSLCVSQSGICYMSDQIGGRSGNLGACAGPCRKNYRLLNAQKKQVGPSRAYLSARDLSTIDQLERFKELGVDSLKIEGRMKSPEYVYTVVKNYKRALLNKEYKFSEIEETQNRRFTKGLAFGDFAQNYSEVERSNYKGRELGKIIQIGKKKKVEYFDSVEQGDIFLFENIKGDKIPLTATQRHQAKDQVYYSHLQDAKVGSTVKRVQSMAIKDELAKDFPKQVVDFELYLKEGEKPRLKATDHVSSIEIDNDFIVQQAKSQPLTEQEIINLLARLGNTLYQAGKIKLVMDDHVFLPKGVINQMRRDATDGLFQARSLVKNRPKVKKPQVDHRIKPIESQETQLVYGSIRENKILTPEGYFYVLASFLGDKDYEILKEKFKGDKEFLGFYGKNLGDLFFARENFPSKEFRFDYFINCWNVEASSLLKELGVSSVTLPIELSGEELTLLINQSAVKTELLVDYPIIVMNNLFCPFSIIYPACKRRCSTCQYREGYLVDDYNNEFYIKRRGQVSEIYFYNRFRSLNEDQWKKSKLSFARYLKEE